MVLAEESRKTLWQSNRFFEKSFHTTTVTLGKVAYFALGKPQLRWEKLNLQYWPKKA